MRGPGAGVAPGLMMKRKGLSANGRAWILGRARTCLGALPCKDNPPCSEGGFGAQDLDAGMSHLVGKDQELCILKGIDPATEHSGGPASKVWESGA